MDRMYFKNHETQSTTWDDPRSGQQEAPDKGEQSESLRVVVKIMVSFRVP